MASSKKKKNKKKPQQVNRTNTTKKPQKEGFFARRERLKKEQERREKVAAIEAERAAKLAKRNEEKEYREKLSKERQQARAEAERAKAEQAVKADKAERSIIPEEPVKPAFFATDSPDASEPSVSPKNAAEPFTEPVTAHLADAELVIEEPVVEQPVSEPVFETIPEPAFEPVPEPAAEPVPQPVSEPVVEENPVGSADDQEEKTDVAEKLSFEPKAKKEDGRTVPGNKQKPVTKSSSKAKSRKKLALLIAVPVVLIGIALLIFFGAKGRNYVPEKAVLVYRGAKNHPSTVRDINIDAEEEAKRIKQLKMKGDKGKFKFYCNLPDTMMLEEWNTPFYPCLANPKDNNCDLVITIFDEEGKLIYRSLGLSPGKYIPKVTLFGNRDYGTYKCRICVAAYDTKTFENIGVQYKNFNLLVGIEGENETEQVSTEEYTTLPAAKPAAPVGTTADQTETTGTTAVSTTAAS